jgi:hypothetical protein
MNRNVLGTKNLGDILSERESIALEMQVRKLFQMYDFSLHVPPPTSYIRKFRRDRLQSHI